MPLDFTKLLCKIYNQIFNWKRHPNGIPTSVIVDDYFPCHGFKNEPIFISSSKNEIYGMILEKAWVK